MDRLLEYVLDNWMLISIFIIVFVSVYMICKNYKHIVHKLTNYDQQFGVVVEKDNLGSYKIEVQKHKNIIGIISVSYKNNDIPVGTIAQLEKAKNGRYNIKMYITKLDKSSKDYKDICESFTEVFTEAVKEHVRNDSCIN